MALLLVALNGDTRYIFSQRRFSGTEVKQTSRCNPFTVDAFCFLSQDLLVVRGTAATLRLRVSLCVRQHERACVSVISVKGC